VRHQTQEYTDDIISITGIICSQLHTNFLGLSHILKNTCTQNNRYWSKHNPRNPLVPKDN